VTSSWLDKKNQLDVTFCILYFSSNSCSTCFGQPCAHHQELTTAWCYRHALVRAVTMRGVTQICLTVSGLCVVMWGVVGGGFVVVCRYTYIQQWEQHQKNPHIHTQPTHSETYLCNTTHCYGTYQHEAITSHSRQLLMMGTWLPETCWANSRREIKNTKSDI